LTFGEKANAIADLIGLDGWIIMEERGSLLGASCATRGLSQAQQDRFERALAAFDKVMYSAVDDFIDEVAA
jgi:hypothetical protein